MSKIRKRSFTNYQNSTQLQQTLLNQVLKQQNQETSSNIHQKSPQQIKISTLGLIKTKKAIHLNKFQKYHQRTARDSTQNGCLSTIQSLKREIIALESDQILSYRHNNHETQQKNSDQHKLTDSQSQISAIIRKFNKMKKQTMTDKFRKKLLLFKGGKLNNSLNTQRSSAKSERGQTKSDQFLVNNRKINLSQSTIFKTKQRKILIDRQRNKDSLSLTARRFYDSKPKVNKMNQSCCSLYERQNSIKKVNLSKKTFSRPILSL